MSNQEPESHYCNNCEDWYVNCGCKERFKIEELEKKLAEAMEVIRSVAQGGCGNYCVSDDCNCAYEEANEFLRKLDNNL